MPPFGFWVQGRTIQSVTASLPLGCIRHLIPGTVPGLHPAPFVALPKKPWKEEGRSKDLTCTVEKNIKELSCRLKPYICKCAHLNNCQFTWPIKLDIQILARHVQLLPFLVQA